ncbi:hypothetical protein [Nocardiopsis synnemataformans]
MRARLGRMGAISVTFAFVSPVAVRRGAAFSVRVLPAHAGMVPCGGRSG